ncbi:MAG: MOSC domain-containing protein [Acidobacteriota bacterium]
MSSSTAAAEGRTQEGQNAVGEVVKIWIKRARRGPMDAVEQATLIAGEGIDGDANRGRTWRQVTLIEDELWQQVAEELGPQVNPVQRRANLLIRGITLQNTRHRILALGETARLEIRGETRPCNLMEETLSGLQAALDPDWRGGAYARVLSGGVLRLGDAVRWEG